MKLWSGHRRGSLPCGDLHRWLPVTLLLIALAWVGWQRAEDAGFAPARVPDSISYLKAAEASTFRGALAHYRSTGYPAFLNLVAAFGHRHERVPEVQAGVFSAATIAFFFAARGFTGSGWLALLAAAPLPFAFINRLVSTLATDHLAASLTLLAVSSLLWLLKRPRQPLAWIALTLTCALTYQVRPSAQIVIVWIPLAAWALDRATGSARGWAWRSGVAASTLLPYLAFCTLRLVMVGHFGLVSFAGSNLAAAAACLVDEPLVAEMPADLQQPTQAILTRRQRQGLTPLTSTVEAASCREHYNSNLWRLLFPIVQPEMRAELRRPGAGRLRPVEVWGRPFQVERDARLQRLGLAIVQRRLEGYAAWVRGSIQYGLARMGRRRPVVVGLVLLVVAAGVRVAQRLSDRLALRPVAPAALTLALAMVAYSALYLFAVSLVSFPFSRYLAGIILLLPPGLLLAAGALLGIGGPSGRDSG